MVVMGNHRRTGIRTWQCLTVVAGLGRSIASTFAIIVAENKRKPDLKAIVFGCCKHRM